MFVGTALSVTKSDSIKSQDGGAPTVRGDISRRQRKIKSALLDGYVVSFFPLLVITAQ